MYYTYIYIYIYIYRQHNLLQLLNLNLLMMTIFAPHSNASKWEMGFNSAFKGCIKNQQIHQLFIQFINYVWQLLHVSALHCHLQGAFVVPSERSSDVVRGA